MTIGAPLGARENIEYFLNHSVYLELWVKVKEAWRSDETFILDKIYRK
jgi:GTPase Era involved in 16S rRNA processing